jgi:Tol biopolymer transport system component/DNA-binding winged helix-turn-helix (wHTH) protein
MSETLGYSRRVQRFGVFEYDPGAGELRKQGMKLKLQGQPIEILALLLERPGEVVTREDLQKKLWPSDTFVDFEHSLNAAVKRLRDALDDSADAPRYVDTLPKRGYRFIGKIDASPTPNEGTNPTGAWRKFAAWTVAGAACVLAAMFVYHRIRPPVDAPTVTPIPFTAYPGLELWPTFSPDGSQIAFAWNGDPGAGLKGFDLYVKVIGSENLLRLTHHPSEALCPAWSPNGTQIAFNRISGADTGLYVVPALGGPERKLRSIRVSDAFGSTAPISWSPDGKSIAFVDFLPPDDKFRVNLLSLETLESKQIAHPAECINGWLPAFSHSGEQLAYVCLLNRDGKEFGIYIVLSSGGPPMLVTRFTTGLGWPHGIAWTANDKKLILSRPRFAYDDELDEVTLADGSLRRLAVGQDAYWPVISAKGDKLAFAALPFHHIDVWRRDLSHPEAAAVKFVSSTRDQVLPQYSPDGRHIAFTSNRAGTYEIWMSDADGTHLVKLSDVGSSDAVSARWSPDSQKIAFDSLHAGHPEVYIVDIAERMPRKVVTNLPDMYLPSWSHDGKWLYFQVSTAHQTSVRVFRCRASGGAAVALSAESDSFPWESYDGKTLYFFNELDKRSVHMVSLQPPGEESVLKGMPAVLDGSQWTVVPGGIYFVAADAPKSVRYFDFATKQIRQVFEVDKDFQNGLSVSPDGRWILYTQADEANSDIMLVEHFQ